VADEVLDRAGVGPCDQGIEILSFASHLLVELVVAFGRHDDDSALLVLDDLPDLRRQAAEFTIRDELAIAHAESPQQLRRPLIDIHPGSHQRTKEVAFAGFIRANVGFRLGWSRGRGGGGIWRGALWSYGLGNGVR